MGVDTGSAADHVVVSTGVTATGHREALASRRGEQRGRRLLDHFALRPPSGPLTAYDTGARVGGRTTFECRRPSGPRSARQRRSSEELPLSL